MPFINLSKLKKIRKLKMGILDLLVGSITKKIYFIMS